MKVTRIEYFNASPINETEVNIMSSYLEDVFLSNFLTHGGKLIECFYSSPYFRSPIATRGLKILINCELITGASKLKAQELYQPKETFNFLI